MPHRSMCVGKPLLLDHPVFFVSSPACHLSLRPVPFGAAHAILAMAADLSAKNVIAGRAYNQVGAGHHVTYRGWGFVA